MSKVPLLEQDFFHDLIIEGFLEAEDRRRRADPDYFPVPYRTIRLEREELFRDFATRFVEDFQGRRRKQLSIKEKLSFWKDAPGLNPEDFIDLLCQYSGFSDTAITKKYLMSQVIAQSMPIGFSIDAENFHDPKYAIFNMYGSRVVCNTVLVEHLHPDPLVLSGNRLIRTLNGEK